MEAEREAADGNSVQLNRSHPDAASASGRLAMVSCRGLNFRGRGGITVNGGHYGFDVDLQTSPDVYDIDSEHGVKDGEFGKAV